MNKPRRKLLIKLSFASFVAIMSASFIFTAISSVLIYFDVPIEDLWWTVIIATISSLVIGITLSTILNIFFITPINELCKVTKRVANGDFSVKLNERKNKKGELKKDEMSVLTHNFNLMVNELDKNKLIKNDFVANISHEFKTPLANIKGHTELIKNLSQDDSIKEYCDSIIESVDNLNVLTSNILRLSKLETHTIVEPNEFRLDEQIRQAVIMLENKWSEKNIEINLDLDNVVIFYDESLFLQVWINLLSNAIKFSNENGEINIILNKYEDKVVCIIKDKGIGMSKEVQNRIFDKFYQGDTSRAREGNGLGLALVKRILDVSNCSIDVRSEPGVGSTFVVKIPV